MKPETGNNNTGETKSIHINMNGFCFSNHNPHITNRTTFIWITPIAYLIPEELIEIKEEVLPIIQNHKQTYLAQKINRITATLFFPANIELLQEIPINTNSDLLVHRHILSLVIEYCENNQTVIFESYKTLHIAVKGNQNLIQAISCEIKSTYDILYYINKVDKTDNDKIFITDNIGNAESIKQINPNINVQFTNNPVVIIE